MCRFVVMCILLFAFKEAQGQTTKVSKCLKSNGKLPINAYVVGCIQPPCILPQLEDIVINVMFEAPYLLDNLTTKALVLVKIGILPIEVNYDLGSAAVTCNFLTNATCPIQQKEVVQYTLNMFVESYIRVGTEATIEFLVEDKNKVPVWCIRAPVKVTKPRAQMDKNQRAQIGKVSRLQSI